MDRLYPAPTAPAHLRAELELDDGRLLRFTDPRRFGHACAARRRGARPLPRRRGSGSSRSSGELTAELIGRIAGRPDGAAEVVPARPEGDRGDRQHLRRRGAAPRRAPPALAGRARCGRALGGAARGDRRGARGGAAQRRRLDRRLPRLPRRAGLDAGRVPRPHPRGAGVPPLRRPDRRGSWSPAARPTSAPRARRGCAGGAGRGAPGSAPMSDPLPLPEGLRGRALDRAGGAHRLHRRPAAARRPRPASTSAAAGPGTRETEIIGPLANPEEATAVLFTRRQRARPRRRRRRDALVRGAGARLRDAGAASCRSSPPR